MTGRGEWKRMKDKVKNRKKKQRKKLFWNICGLLFGLCLVMGVSSRLVYAEGESTDNRKLQNGSFEKGQTWTSTYLQPDQDSVPGWNTTATDKKIELFRKNTGTYIPGVTLEPSNGSYAAELNANEESTLYQNVTTPPSSIYEWGLDHGARNDTDTMALVIGPKQSVDPTKPNKSGRDQLMQMVDWLIEQGKTSVKTSSGLGEQLTVYSKKFAAGGTFEDNAGNNAFSMTPSTIYTEEWHIWIMASSRATSGTNPWNPYGSNAEGSGNGNEKYYRYKVPTGQTETMFGFVSVGCDGSITTSDKAKTYGNFLDNINFKIYHPLTASSTAHGSAVVAGSGGTIGNVDVDNQLSITYVKDGEQLTIQAIVKKKDADAGCEFVGVNYTVQDENGNPNTQFLKNNDSEWTISTNGEGDIIYTRNLDAITSATDLHFIFIKSPTVTYDPNGGKAYVVERTYNTLEAGNVYSFKPNVVEGNYTFIAPYVSHAAEGQNDGWKFMGWLLTGDTVENIPESVYQVNADKLGILILPAEHTVACDYSLDGASGQVAAQYFKIYNGSVLLTETINKEDGTIKGVTWTDNGEPITYANAHKGLTMVAQWRWLQAFIPQLKSSDTYVDSEYGGTVEITSVTDKSDTNYNAAYTASGGKSYHAITGEIITATATPKDGFNFEGWYDANGNLITANATYSYVETKESVNTYYARFSGNVTQVTQTYIRQLKNGDVWDITTDDTIGTLDRYSHTDVPGVSISSSATAGTGYRFVGWYDSGGNPVDSRMLVNDGKTINYITTGDATYYARYDCVLSIKKTKDPEELEDVNTGDVICYVLELENQGDSDIRVKLVDNLPPEVKGKKYEIDGVEQVGDWPGELDDFLLPAGKKVIVRISAEVTQKFSMDNPEDNIISNTASMVYDGKTFNTGEVKHYLTPNPSYTLTKERITQPPNELAGFFAGSKLEIVYKATLTNDGNIPLTFDITDAFEQDDKFEFVEGKNSFSGITLQAGKSTDVYFKAKIKSNATSGNEYLNTVTATGTGSYIDPKRGAEIPVNLEKKAEAYTPVIAMPTYNLPDAGGIGTYWLTTGGVILMAAAVILLIKNRRNTLR